MLIRSAVGGFAHRVLKSSAGIWVPRFDVFAPKHMNILAVLDGPGGKILIPGANLVTNAGDIHYAQKGASEAPTNAFGVHEMCTAGTPGKAADRSDFTTIASTEKAHSATYPKTDDQDVDNTGGGTDIVTYLADYAKADFNNPAISHGIITNATPGATEPLLTGYSFAAPFEKTSNDTLKVFVNHTMNGI